MNDDSRAAWVSLIEEKRTQLRDSPSALTLDTTPRNPAEFRVAFETLYRRYRQTRAQSWLGAFLRHFQPIQLFAAHIDGAGNLSAPNSLASLFWACALALIETAFLHRIPLAHIEQLIGPFCKTVPNFGANLAEHFTVVSVQKPLQTLFSEYIDCYIIMLSHFATSPPPLSFEPINKCFDNATAIFAQAKQEWDQALREANEAAERQRLEFASAPGVPNGLDRQSLRPQTTNVHFEPLRYLGHGTFGQVSEVRECSTGQHYARKMIRVRPDSRASHVIEEQIRSEVAIMQKLRHPHIAAVLFSVRDQSAISIIMLPVAECDLFHYLEVKCSTGDKNTIRQLDSWFGCLVVALAYAHQVKVKHHDIKPCNILIKNEQPYLSDFGSAKDFSELETSISPVDAVVGTPIYFAPERHWGRSADVFALGCVFSDMLTVRSGRKLEDFRAVRRGSNPQQSLAFRESLPQVREWLRTLEDQNREPLKLMCSWTIRMLNENPDDRPEAREVRRGLRRIEEADMLFCTTCGA